jgi:hypothetical protein
VSDETKPLCHRHNLSGCAVCVSADETKTDHEAAGRLAAEMATRGTGTPGIVNLARCYRQACKERDELRRRLKQARDLYNEEDKRSGRYRAQHDTLREERDAQRARAERLTQLLREHHACGGTSGGQVVCEVCVAVGAPEVSKV